MSTNRNYWLRSRVSRRGLIRVAGIGAAGLAGAALIGCGSSDEEATAAAGGGGGGGGATATAAAGGGGAAASGRPTTGPMALTRAPGHPNNPDFVTPISWKTRVMGGRLNMVGDYSTRQNDPDLAAALAIGELLNDRLVYPNGWTTELVPDLLESYEFVSAEEVVLKMRAGVKTHNKAPTNGRIMTAEDIAFSINRKAGILDPEQSKKYPRRAQFFGMTNAEAIDDVTTRMTFSQPNGAIMGAFSDMRAGVTPKEAADTDFKALETIPGAGPWMLKENIPGTRQVFEPHPEYYRTDDEGGRPSFDTLEFATYPDRAAYLAAFITGDVDYLGAVAPHEGPQLDASAPKGYYRYKEPSATLYHFAINPELVPAASDTRVRQGLQLSIDYDAIMDPVSAPGWLNTGPLHPLYPESSSSPEIKKRPGYNPETKDADIAEAKKLFEAAGFADGAGIQFEIMTVAAAGGHFDTAVRLQDQWSKVFPQMKVDIVPASDYAAFQAKLANRDHQARVYDFAATPNVALDALTYYHSTGGRNYQHFNEPWADALIEKILASIDQNERTQLVHDFEDQYIGDGPRHLPLGVTMVDHAFQPTVGGLDLVSGTWSYFYTFAYGGNHRWLWRTEADGEVTYPA